MVLGRAVARLRNGPRARYRRFVREVEPALDGHGRVHRFAQAPTPIPADLAAAPMALCIDPAGGGDAAVTRESVGRQRVPPALIVERPAGEALGGVESAWMAVVAAGDRLAPAAMQRLGQAALLAPDASVITADDDVWGGRGGRREPRLRPGPSPDLWLTQSPEIALRATRVAAVEAGEPHAHIPQVLCHRRTPGSPAVAPSAGERVRRPLAAEPAVEVVVCLRDRPDLLQRCAGSLLDHTAWDRLTLRLVDNASTDPETVGLLHRLARDPRVTVDRDPREFNFSALNHAAATRSGADLLVFLNNDTEVIEPDWIEVLAEEAVRPEVGAVAPMLLYRSGRVQHAGVAIGIHGWAGHPFAGLRPEERTPFGAAADGTRNWLAVSAACMMVERRKYLAVGGFDSVFAVGGGDVDLCLRLTAAGHRSLCVPHARLIHDESASRDPAAVPPGDFEASRRSYGAFRTVGDPFYHPALTLRDSSCRLRGPDERPAP